MSDVVDIVDDNDDMAGSDESMLYGVSMSSLLIKVGSEVLDLLN